MDLGLLKIVLKLVVLFASLVALGFGVILLFFYEHFAYFNELANTAYFTKKKGYRTGGQGYLFDNWVMGWHTGFGVICLVVGVWLFWVFLSYLSL